MTAYVINKEKCSVYSKHKDHWGVNMSEDFGPEAYTRYILLRSEDEAYEWWHLANEESGKFYEGTGYSENQKHDMFKDWLEE